MNRMNELKMNVLGPCKRCQMITIEQSTAEITQEPLHSLAAMKKRNFNFGVHTKPELPRGGNVTIHVGDKLCFWE